MTQKRSRSKIQKNKAVNRSRQKRRIVVAATILLFIILGSFILFFTSYGHRLKRLFFPPTVSVVMPTYNRISLLPRSIESILAQTFEDFELIIVDDGSTDGSDKLLASYADRDSRVVVLTNSENKGISYSRNRGNAAARGKYIAIMDSDDISTPDRLSRSVAFLEENPDMTAVNSTYTKTTSAKANNWVPKKRLDILMNLGNYYTHLALVRRDFVVQNDIRYNEAYIGSEDYDFWRQIIFAGGELAMLNRPLLILRRHRTNGADYYRAIKENRKKISAQFLARFDIDEETAFRGNRCELLSLMMDKNPRVALVDQESLEFTFRRECGEENLPTGTLYIKHTDWLDNLLPDGVNRFKRQRTGEEATILYQDKEYLILEWEDGREEAFQRQENAYALIDNDLVPSF